MLSRDAVQWWLQLLRLPPQASNRHLAASDADQLIRLARHEQVLSWYWQALRKSGQLPQLSEQTQKELRGYGLSTAAQQLLIASETVDVVRVLSAHGIRSVLLKGAAYGALGDRYPYLPSRPTSDADVLVEPGRAEEAWQLLSTHGFRRATEKPSIHPDHHHLPQLTGSNGLSLELHMSASLFLSLEESWARFGEGAERLVWRGQEVLVPNATELLWHSIAHSLGDGSDGCRLRHLLTTAALFTSSDVNWDTIVSRVRSETPRHHNSRHRLRAEGVRRWMTACAWLAGVSLPAAIRTGDNVEQMLVKLLTVQWHILNVPQERAVRARRYGDEAYLAAFGLGRQRGGHWQSWWRRHRYSIASALYQARYRSRAASRSFR